ncbi:MAG: hypothetical protein VX589_05745 [Myxococcota bacterium]|nr:hypothetical protein [Myxococcota bacterium]
MRGPVTRGVRPYLCSTCYLSMIKTHLEIESGRERNDDHHPVQSVRHIQREAATLSAVAISVGDVLREKTLLDAPG